MRKNRRGLGAYAAWIALAAMISYAQHAPKFMRGWGFKAILLLAYYGWKSRVRLAIGHLRTAFPDAPGEKLEETARRSYMNLAAFCTEFCLMRYLTKENADAGVKFSGLENLDEAFKRGRGVVLVWAHFDHFEMVNYALALKGYPVYTLIREVDNPMIDRMLNKIRETSGQKIIWRDGAATEMIKRLREGAIVTIATDQNALYNSVFVKFFGKWASTIKSPAVVHLRTGAPIIPVYSVREADDTHSAKILPEIKITPTGNVKRDVALITQKIADVQAGFISQRPDLWLWLHRRWKIQPDAKELEELAAR
jgi:KDO2-lipid IV(A) lauroyltransferase